MAKISLGKRVFEKIPLEARSNEDNNEERKAGKRAVEMGQQGENKNTILNKKELNRTEGAANTSSVRMLSPLHCII